MGDVRVLCHRGFHFWTTQRIQTSFSALQPARSPPSGLAPEPRVHHALPTFPLDTANATTIHTHALSMIKAWASAEDKACRSLCATPLHFAHTNHITLLSYTTTLAAKGSYPTRLKYDAASRRQKNGINQRLGLCIHAARRKRLAPF